MIAAVAFSFGLSNATLGDELAEREAIKIEVASLVRSEQFVKLEALVEMYRTSKSRTSSGLWHLTLFHIGVRQAFDANRGGETYWQSAKRRAEKWVAAFPNSPTAQLAYATMMYNYGLSFTANVPYSMVAPKDKLNMGFFVRDARLYLEKNKAVAAQDPRWYELMIGVARLESWPAEDLLKLMSEGLQREPQFYQTYFAAIDYFAGFRGAGVAAIDRIARFAVDSTRQTEGLGMYARAYWYASQTVFGDRLFLDSMVDWPTMKKGIDDVLKRYPDNWNLNNFAKFACLAQDKAKTAELLARINEGPIEVVWGSPSAFQNCQDWSSGLTTTPKAAAKPIAYRGG